MFVPNDGELGLLKMIKVVWQASGDDCHLRLYTDSALTIDEDTVVGDLTEPTGGSTWYAPRVVTFTTPAIEDGRAVMQTTTSETWQGNDTDPATIYGWFMTFSGEGTDSVQRLIVIHELAAPVTIDTPADLLTVLPKFFLHEITEACA